MVDLDETLGEPLGYIPPPQWSRSGPRATGINCEDIQRWARTAGGPPSPNWTPTQFSSVRAALVCYAPWNIAGVQGRLYRGADGHVYAQAVNGGTIFVYNAHPLAGPLVLGPHLAPSFVLSTPGMPTPGELDSLMTLLANAGAAVSGMSQQSGDTADQVGTALTMASAQVNSAAQMVGTGDLVGASQMLSAGAVTTLSNAMLAAQAGGLVLPQGAMVQLQQILNTLQNDATALATPSAGHLPAPPPPVQQNPPAQPPPLPSGTPLPAGGGLTPSGSGGTPTWMMPTAIIGGVAVLGGLLYWATSKHGPAGAHSNPAAPPDYYSGPYGRAKVQGKRVTYYRKGTRDIVGRARFLWKSGAQDAAKRFAFTGEQA
jgi:hypothetical protein